MPYVFDPNLEKEDENQNPGQVQISGASPTTDSSGTNGGGNTQKEKLNTGSGFQNLDSYLNTNQSKQFGQQVANKVGNEIDSAKTNQAQAANQFRTQVGASNTLPTNEQVNSALANPTQTDNKQFQNWQTQSYQGPKSLAESPSAWNQYWSGVNKAGTSAKELGSEPGRFSLLDSYFGKPSYNTGEKSLDNLLIQQSGIGKQSRDLQNQSALLRSQGTDEEKNLQGYAATRAGDVDASRNLVNQEFDQANNQAQDAVTQSLNNANQSRSAQQQAIASGLGENRLTNDQLAQLGLSQGQDIYNLDLRNYLTPGQGLTKEQVASDDQRSRINALSQLAGIDQTFLGDKQASTDPYTFKNKEFLKDLTSSQGRLNDLKSQLSDDALYKALNVGNTGFRTVLPSNDLNQNMDFIQKQAQDFRSFANNKDALTNGSGTTAKDQENAKQKADALENIVKIYNEYKNLNTGRRLGESPVEGKKSSRPVGAR